MEARSERQSGGGAAVLAIVALVLIVLPAVYVASLGPVVWLVEQNYISSESRALQAIYWPLEAAAQRSPTVMNVLTFYVDLFR